MKYRYSPDKVSHPGSILLDLMEERRMTVEELAKITGHNACYIQDIIDGKEDIPVQMMGPLERIFEVPVSFWMNRKANYNNYIRSKKH